MFEFLDTRILGSSKKYLLFFFLFFLIDGIFVRGKTNKIIPKMIAVITSHLKLYIYVSNYVKNNFFSDNYDYTGQMPLIVSNNFYEDFLHMITENMNINGTDYRVICLYEKDKYIFSSFNFEKKSILC